MRSLNAIFRVYITGFLTLMYPLEIIQRVVF